MTQSIVINTADSTEPYFPTDETVTIYFGQHINITCLSSTTTDFIPEGQLENQWTYLTSNNIDEYEIENTGTSSLSTTLMINQVNFYNKGLYNCSSSLSACEKQTVKNGFQLILKGNLCVYNND